MVTRTGWCVLGVALALFIAAIVLSMPALMVLAAAFAATLGVGLVWVRYRPPLVVERSIDPVRVTVGDAAMAHLVVKNPTSRLSLPLEAYDSVGADRLTMPIPRLKPGAEKLIQYALPTSRRAVVEVGPLRVVRSDPFGTARAEQGRGETETLFVHPHRHAIRPLAATFERSLEGLTSDSSPLGTQVFHQLREYVPGDDRRMIHWKSSARTGTLLVRQHVDSSLPDLTVLLDNRFEKMRPEAFEDAVEIAASLICSCTDQGYPTRLRLTDGARVDPPASEHATTYFLDRLAGVTQNDRGDLAALATVSMASADGYALAVITANPTSREVGALATLVRRYSTVYLIDVDPQAGREPFPGVIRIDASSARSFAQQWNQGFGRQ